MSQQEAFKQPSNIALGIIAGGFWFLPLFTLSVEIFGRSESESGNGLDLVSDMDKLGAVPGFGALDYLVLLIPIAAGLLLFLRSKPDHEMATEQNINYAKIGLLALAGFGLLKYLFLSGGKMEEHGFEIEFACTAGFGMYLIFLAAAFVMFEDKVMEMIGQKTGGGDSGSAPAAAAPAEPTPAPEPTPEPPADAPASDEGGSEEPQA